MKKLLGSAALCGVALVGSLAAAGPTSAGEDPLDMQVDKTTVGRGDVVTISSVDSCSGSQVVVTVAGPGGLESEFGATLKDDGSWTADWFVLEDDPSGDYTVAAECHDDSTIPSRHYEEAGFAVFDYPGVADGLTMSISPAEATSGGTVTLSSVTPCPTFGVDRVVAWAVFSVVVNGDDVSLGEIVSSAFGNLAADGSWTASFSAPQAHDAYVVAAACGRTGYGNDDGPLEAFYVTTGVYEPQALLVGPEATVPPGPLPNIDEIPSTPAPAPAAAVSGKPTFG